MKTAVLVQEAFGVLLIEKLIDEERERYGVDIRLVKSLTAAGASSHLYSYARTLLVSKRTPVAVVLDARTAEPDAAADFQFDVEEVIGAVGVGVPFRVVVAVPELEILFFHRPELLKRLFGGTVSEHILEIGELSPTRALKKLAPDRPYEEIRTELLKAMDEADVQALRQDPLIQSLIDFINKVAERSPRSAVSGV